MRTTPAALAPLLLAIPLAAQAPDTVALSRELPEMMEALAVPGLSIAVVQDGRIQWSRAFGTLGDRAGTPVDENTVFEAASLSKPVFAYIVLRLVDRGEFDLDRPLHEILPYPRLEHDDRYRKITARIVLTHATGLPNWGEEQLSLAFDPGTGYGYSGEGFVFLQKAVERLTGLPLEALARREVFEPLRMTQSSFVWQDRFAGNAAHARDNYWNVRPISTETQANSASSLITTATDYARFVAAVLNRTGLSAESWHQFLTPTPTTDQRSLFGLGIGVQDSPGGRRFYHSGSNGNRFTSLMAGEIETGAGFVFLTSAYDGIRLADRIGAAVMTLDESERGELESFEDPRHLASLAVQRAAVRRGAIAASERYRMIRDDPRTRPTTDEALQLAEVLSARGFTELALEVLRDAAEADASAAILRTLARTLLAAGQVEGAIDAYRRALAAEPDDSVSRERIAWIEAHRTARARPIRVPGTVLRSYVGEYDSRRITFRDGRLHYRRGDGREYPLTPLARDLFALDGAENFRVRFVGDGRSPATRIVGIDIDGWSNEMQRTR